MNIMITIIALVVSCLTCVVVMIRFMNWYSDQRFESQLDQCYLSSVRYGIVAAKADKVDISPKPYKAPEPVPEPHTDRNITFQL